MTFKAKPQSACIVGAGRMGEIHAQALTKLGLKLTAVADTQTTRAIDMARKFEGTEIYKDVATMLTDCRPEFVVVATTTPSRFAIGIAAIEQGASYLMMEKPIATSISDAQQLLKLCEQRSVSLAINHQSRFLKRYRFLKDLMGGEDFGDLVNMHVSGSHFGLAMNGIHYIEVFLWLTGSPVKTVSANITKDLSPNPRGAEFSDYSGSLSAFSADGSSLTIDCPDRAGHGILIILTLEFGKVVLNDLTGEIWAWSRTASDRALPSNRYGTQTVRSDWVLESESLLEGTLLVYEAMFGNGVDQPATYSAVEAIGVLAAAIESSNHNGSRINPTNVSPISTYAWA